MHPQQDPREPSQSEDLPLRPPRGPVSGIRKQYVRLALVLIVAVIAAALVIGLGIDFRPRLDGEQREIDLPPREVRPAELAGLPDNYAEVPRPEPPPREEASAGEGGGPAMEPVAELQRQNAELRRNLASMMSAIERIDADNKELLDQVARYQDQASEAQSEAWRSAVLFEIDGTLQGRSNSNGATAVVATRDEAAAPFPPPVSGTASGPEQPQRPPTDQERKRAFLREDVAPDAHLDRPYLHPRSAYELQAGTVIPAALLTGINTDLPGEIVAAVTAPIYDSATGEHLLIPQGARLLGSYDSEIANGQNRALLVWHRLLMPSGRSITLERMPGTDAVGYAGVADRVDYHADKLAAGAALSSVLAFAGNLARGDTDGNEDARDVIGDTVAQEASRIGSKVIDRQLDVQPTITVRPGWPVRVLVHKDILLAPYDAQP